MSKNQSSAGLNSSLLKLIGLGVVAATLTGCAMSPLPQAENFQYTTQKKVRSAGHWALLSRDVVDQTLVSLTKAGATPETALFVALPPNASPFDSAFREFLITELVQRGRRVQGSDAGAMVVDYQARVIKHNSPRPNFVPGGFTMLTAGVFVLRELASAGGVIGSFGLAGMVDAAGSANAGGPTSTELILSTTVTSAGRYVSRKTDVYYIEESDSSLFYGLTAGMGGKAMKVVSE